MHYTTLHKKDYTDLRSIDYTIGPTLSASQNFVKSESPPYHLPRTPPHSRRLSETTTFSKMSKPSSAITWMSIVGVSSPRGARRVCQARQPKE